MHLVQRGPALLVHEAAARVRVERFGLGGRLSLVVTGLREPGGQLGRTRVGRMLGQGGGRVPAVLERAVRGQPSRRTCQPRIQATHGFDATVPSASCPVNAPFRPERRPQSGPTKTVGRRCSGLVTTYEILLMLDPELAEQRQDELIVRVRELVEKSGGTWRSHDAWGRRRLAFEIAKKTEGVYHLVVFESGAEALDEIVRVLKIDDVVLRHMATKHIEGSRTTAPRDDTPVPVAAAVAVAVPEPEPVPVPEAVAVPEAEYPDANTRSDEE